MNAKKLVIAIDGPAASGKSTTARLVAERLGYLHVDTGAMYRAITLKVLKFGLKPDDVGNVGRLLTSTRVELQRTNDSVRVLLDGEDVTEGIRTAEVTKAVSAVSQIRQVREAMVREQRKMAEGQGIVLEGRDIGTIVFPKAHLKIFMVANLEARARRRQDELKAKGINANTRLILEEIQERDELDTTRDESPLKRAADAIELDNSNLTINEQVEFVLKKAKRLLEQNEVK
ncbi:MAG: (d)CMP kinase [Ignavibacteria bacterium]|nr:(d)CMP kinase [Ignavibacteria bacterium]